jgi:hypothetical protein
MSSFDERSTQSELMDDSAVSFDEFNACLRDLSRVNTVTLGRGPTLAWLSRATRTMRRGDTLSLLDVGFGHGDMLRAIHEWCLTKGFEPDLSGIDLSPWSAASARAATPSHMRITYHTEDVFAFQPERPVDLVVSSLFTHHLRDADIVKFVKWMESTAKRGWFINDLHRHPVPFYVFRAMARIAGWHRFVQHDGPVSIARSFRRADWERLTQAAGVEPPTTRIRWHIPFRICVSRMR